jgi:peroxiredoxin
MTAAPAEALAAAFVRSRDMDAALGERLEAYSNAVREFIPAYADAVDQLVSRLSSSGAGLEAPRPGEPMPPFVLPDERGRLTSLESLLQNGPIAITFHRGHWCPWCRISASVMAQARRDIAAARGQIAAIMPERQRFAMEFKSSTKSPFPVFTDVDNGYALSLNLAIWVGPDLERLLSSFGRSLPDYQGNEAWMLPIPATFVIARDGIVTARFIDPDFRRRMSVEELIAALEAASKRGAAHSTRLSGR